MSVVNDRLSIGIILIAESGGGAAVAVKRLIDLFGESSVEVHVLGNELSWMRSVDVHEHQRVTLPAVMPGSLTSSAAALGGARPLFRTLLAIRRYSRDHPSLVLLPFLTGTSLVTLAATLGLQNPVVVCERNDPSRQRHGWHVEILKRLLYPRATAITVNAPNHAARDHLVRVSRGRPVQFVPNPRPKGVTPADVESSRVILSVGRLVPQKRHKTLIEAFARVHSRLPEWSLCIAGDGPLSDELTQLVERLDLSGRVKLVQHADDVRPLYASAALFVLASDYEGTSNALLEAASAGLPCVVSDEAAPPGTEGVLRTVPAGCTAELAACVLELCANSNLRAQLGAAAQHWVQLVTDEDVVMAWESAARPLSAPGSRKNYAG